jgi:hypothetical protein
VPADVTAKQFLAMTLCDLEACSFIRDVAVPNRKIHRPAFLNGSRAACEEVHDHRNDGEQQEDMNQATGDVKKHEASHPEDEQ